MPSSLSSNVILAKIKSKFGNRLTDADYQSLLNMNSVSEIAAYLKNNTIYSEVLSGINENTIHRAQLESLLKQKAFTDVHNLCQYEIATGEHFADYILKRSCIGIILKKILILITGNQIDEIPFAGKSILALTEKHSKIDIKALQAAKSYDELIASVGDTDFARILKEHKPEKGQPINYSEIGSALYYCNFKNAFDIAEKYCSGSCQKELLDLFGTLMDLFNYVRIIRMKKNYNCTPEYVRSMLLPKGNVSNTQLEAMIAAATANDVTSIFKSTSTGKKVSDLEYNYLDEICLKYKYQMCKHYMRFSLNSPVVLMSYIFLMEVELGNVTHIIEGIRYNVDKDKLKKLIIS